MKNGILRRMTAVLLAIVCIITGMPEVLLTAYADETQVVETEGFEQPEQITETEASTQQQEIMTEEAESTERPEAAGTEETENTEETETATEESESTEKPETVTEETEFTEQTEIAAGEAESMEQTEDTENTEQSEIPTEEAEILEESTQSTENVQTTEAVLETEIMHETETVSETETMTGDYGIILPADAEETGTTIDASYTDANGIVYSYYGYEDGTADIYAIADYDGKEVAVPTVIDGYTVTQITAQLSYDTQLVSLTLPETIIFLGEYCFQVDGIGTLYYNATEVSGIESVYGAPFLGVAIGNLVIGDNVRVIPDRMFYQAGFAQDEVVLSVETIRESAFSYAEFQTLTITDSVRYLYGDAFENADIKQLNYCSNAESVESGSAAGVFHSANIYALSIGENVAKLADYLFALSYLRFKKFAVNVETIGKGTFYEAWTNYSNTGDYSVDLTLGEDVQFIGAEAFYNTAVSTLHLNASAKTGASNNTEGGFYSADIGTLVISEQVEKIPDYLFSGANVTVDTLDLNVKEIGKYAFYDGPKIANLIIGESVEEIGVCAFAKGSFTQVVFEAVHANVGGQESISTGDSPFYTSTISSLQIGSQVEIIPRCLFADSKLSVTELAFPDCLTEIGASAFYELSSNQMKIGTLTIGQNVTAIGMGAFYSCSIEMLNYDAANAVVSGASGAGDSPFWAADVGELELGENITQLPSYLFCGFNLTQEELVLPEKLTRIGAYAISSRSLSPTSVSIGTLTVGENLEYIDRLAFCYLTFENVIVHAVEGDEAFKQLSFTSNGLPSCTNVQIHSGSDFYEFFTKRTSAENVTSMCQDFVTSYGEAYYDTAEDRFVIPITDTCTVCGYEKKSEQYEEAYTVTFLDYDGRVISTQYLRLNEDAEAPESPQRTGYAFLGWDKAFTGITADLTVTAQYEIQKFSVVFKDGETVLSEQTVEYGKDAVLPAEPARPAEEWGTWKFTGWNGAYTNITKDETITAEFEKVWNEYTVIFYDANGNILSEQTVVYGQSAIVPEAPEKEADAQYSYTFTGWSEDYTAVTEDMQIHPVYDSQLRSYTVTFLDAKGNVLETKDVSYGNAVELPEAPTKEADAAYDYVFTGWDADLTEITQDIVTRPVYDAVIHTYKVTFKDGETILSEQTIEYGKDAVLPENPTRPEEEWGTWKFTGWNGTYTNITKAETIIAEFEKVWNEYTVIFYDAEGNILSEQTVVYGQSAIVPEAPEKEADAQYTYTFTGWSEDYTAVTEDMQIYPEYVSILRKYTVTFKDGELVLKEQEVEYGSDAELPEEPTRAEEEWGIWKFTGWLGNYLGITQDETVQAVFEKVLNRYTVSFADADGNVIDTQFVEHGKAAVPPEQPAKEADAQYEYSFAGWDGNTGNITKSVVFYPVYDKQIRSYSITFVDGENILSEQTIEYGKDAVLPENPTRPEEEWGTWKFVGWNGTYTNITKAETVTAEFEKVWNEYTVIFYDADGDILSEQTVVYGQSASVPKAPEKEADAQYSYTFTGWSEDYTAVTADMQIYPEYVSILRKYTITFKDGELVLKEQEVEYGNDAELPEEPTRPAEEWGTWKFVGWNGTYTNITKDETITAEFEKVWNEYNVIFYDAEGNILSEQTVVYGQSPIVPEAPEKEADAQYSYTFTGWSEDYTAVTADMQIYPEYISILRKYTVTFKDGELVLKEQEVEYGSDAELPEEPTRPTEEWGTWKFVGWNGAYTNIKKDETITAEFEKVWNEYIVIFYDAEGNILSEQTVVYGQSAIVPEAPEKEADAQYSYTFTGWSEGYTAVTADMQIYPEYVSILRKYTVIFKDGELVLKEQEVEYGSDAELPKEPTRPAEEWGTWKFTGWLGNYLDITQDETVQAVFEKVLNRYTVSFADAEGNVIDTQFVEHGKAAVLPEQPAKEADAQYEYSFAGWDGDTGNITKSVVFYPVYNKQIRSYSITFVDGETVLSEQTVEYGKDAVLPENPTRPAEEWGTWKFTGWDGTYQNIQKEETVYAVFEKTMNVYTVIFEDGSGNVLSRQKVEHGQAVKAPDNPQKEADAEYRYIFIGWDKEYDAVVENMTIHALYDKEKIVKPDEPTPEPENPSEPEEEDPTPELENPSEPEEDEPTPEPENPGEAEEEEPSSEQDNSDESEETSETETEITDSKTEEIPEDTEAEQTITKTDKKSDFWWLLMVLVIAAILAWFFLCLLLWVSRRKICGTVYSVDGKPMANVLVILEGKKRQEICTDKNGYYCFKSLKKRDWTLSISDEEERPVLKMNICMKEKEDDKVFHIVQSCCITVDVEQEHKKYTINVTA